MTHDEAYWEIRLHSIEDSLVKLSEQSFHVIGQRDSDKCYIRGARGSFVAESFTDGFSTMNTNINATPATCCRRFASS